jgi:hypothetical protein
MLQAQTKNLVYLENTKLRSKIQRAHSIAYIQVKISQSGLALPPESLHESGPEGVLTTPQVR